MQRKPPIFSPFNNLTAGSLKIKKMMEDLYKFFFISEYFVENPTHIHFFMKSDKMLNLVTLSKMFMTTTEITALNIYDTFVNLEVKL